MILNYTTKIDADKTAAEISKCLSLHGAQAVMTEYNQEDQTVSAISFKISMDGQTMSFRLPCDWKPVYTILAKGKKIPRDTKRRERMESDLRLQAVRTAWRIVKDWVEAQMALIETKMVETAQVFLPYAIVKGGLTVAEKMKQDPQFLLGNGE